MNTAGSSNFLREIHFADGRFVFQCGTTIFRDWTRLVLVLGINFGDFRKSCVIGIITFSFLSCIDYMQSKKGEKTRRWKQLTNGAPSGVPFCKIFSS